jgi:hypothetical protein
MKCPPPLCLIVLGTDYQRDLALGNVNLGLLIKLGFAMFLHSKVTICPSILYSLK